MSSAKKDHALSGHCIWLVPSSPAGEELFDIVRELTVAEDGSPLFAPHITLLGYSEMANDPKELAAALERAVQSLVPSRGPLKLTLNVPQAGDKYYQCVLSPVEQSDEPGQALLGLRQALEWEVGGEHPATYFPHLSLLYSDCDMRSREDYASNVKETSKWPRVVEFAEAVVVDVTGEAEHWKEVARVKL